MSAKFHLLVTLALIAIIAFAFFDVAKFVL